MDEKQARRMGTMVVMSSWLAMFMLFGMRCTFAVLKIPMAEELQWTDASITAGFGVMMILYGITAFLSGTIVDRWGPKPCYLIAAIASFVSLYFTAQMNSMLAYLLIYGVCGGVATGMCWVSSTVAVRRWYIGKDYAKRWGLAFAGGPMAQVLLSLLCGRMMPVYGWRVTARVLAIIMLVGMLLATWLAKRGPETYGAKPFGDLDAGKKTVEEEYVWKVGEAWSTYAVWGATAFFLTAAISEFLVWTQTVSFFVTDVGYSLEDSVHLYMLIGIVGIFAMPLMGMFSDMLVRKFGHEPKGRKLNLILCPCVGIIACLSILQSGSSVVFAVAACVLFPIYWAMMPGGVLGYVGSMYGRKTLGKIWGIGTLIAISVGPAAGSIMGGFLRDTTGKVSYSFWLAIGTYVLALIAAISLPIKVVPRHLRKAAKDADAQPSK